MTKTASKHMQKRAARIARQISKWARRDPRTGQVAYYVPASEQEPFEPVRAYKVATDGSVCSCASFWHRGVCSHSLAAQIVTSAPKE